MKKLSANVLIVEFCNVISSFMYIGHNPILVKTGLEPKNGYQ